MAGRIMCLCLVTAILILGAAIGGANGEAMVSGSVFCDQCKDGQVSLFDYPLTGIKVSMVCPGQSGQLKVISEETTNFLGSYVMRFNGASDMSGCRAQVSGDGQGCRAVAGPAQSLNLVFQMFDTAIYTVGHLISQPAQPMANCPRSSSPVPTPVPVTPTLPPPAKSPPVSHPPPQLPPLPRLPPMPSVPFLEASACPYRMWTMPQHECYWRVLAPDLKVSFVFGPLAARKYGNDITLRGSMEGRGDPYRTLLREATTALLNSYNSIQFPYHPFDVVQRLNYALVQGSTRQVLLTALQFLRANSGRPGNVSCKFTTCNIALVSTCHAHKEATIHELRIAFNQNRVNSRQLVEFYLGEIKKLNPVLKGVLEVNPDALYEADRADKERTTNMPWSLVGLHGIPVLLKDSIATKDKLNTTSGSFALLGSIVPRDAGIVSKLRKSGAIILGKASLSEWSDFRSLSAPSGWSPRGGQGKNPYVLSASPCGSSSGPAISVAANMAAVSIGTETDGSILCPASFNSVVGIKPTVGLTSRAGIIPVSPSLDTIGPICRTVSDAVYVLDTIVGFDYNDRDATRKASRYIPYGGYSQFLKLHGLKGKRIGVVRNPFFVFSKGSNLHQVFENHLQTLRKEGAILIDNLEIIGLRTIFNATASGEAAVAIAEFKIAINAYLKSLVASSVRSLTDVIAFNNKFSDLEKVKNFGQDIFLAAEATNGIGELEKAAITNMARLTREGYEKMMTENRLDAVVTTGANISPVLAIGGFPAISVPAAYDDKGVPVGICFSGLKGSEPTLIEISYGFEQATNVRKIPTFLP